MGSQYDIPVAVVKKGFPSNLFVASAKQVLPTNELNTRISVYSCLLGFSIGREALLTGFLWCCFPALRNTTSLGTSVVVENQGSFVESRHLWLWFACKVSSYCTENEYLNSYFPKQLKLTCCSKMAAEVMSRQKLGVYVCGKKRSRVLTHLSLTPQ